MAGVGVWVSVAAAVSLGGSIFCGMLCAGMGPGFVMVVIVVGIIKVDMVSIFAAALSRLRRTVPQAIRHVTRKDYASAAPSKFSATLHRGEWDVCV